MAPKPQSQTLPIYSCGSHWHFEPHFFEEPHNSGWFPRLVRIPWYMRKEGLGRGKYQAGQGGIYVRNASGTFRIHYLLESGFYSLKDEGGKVQRCKGRLGDLEDIFWREEDLSLTPWGPAGSIPLPTYSAVDWETYATGYEGEQTPLLRDGRLHMRG